MSKEREEKSLDSKEEIESTSLRTPTRVREGVPTLEQVIDRARFTIGFTDTRWLTNWYNFMSLADWCDEDGNRIRNWGHLLGKYIKNRALFDELRNPERIRGKGKSAAKRPANYLPSEGGTDGAF